MDEVMNSEEIFEPAENETEVSEDYYVDDNTSSASMIPAVGLGLAIGAAAAIGIPKAVKGIKKLGVKAKSKLTDKVDARKAKKASKKEAKYVEVSVEDED